MSRRRLLASFVLLLVASVALQRSPAAAGTRARPPARAAGACSLKGLEQEHLGPSYVTSLNVSGVSCATGKRVVSGYYRCRLRSGGVRGHCHARVLGFSCREKRNGISVQFFATVTCVRGPRRVLHTYVQNT